MGEKKEKVVKKTAAQHLKERGGQEKPVYAAVKTNYFCREPYRAVLLNNIKSDGTITIKQKVTIQDRYTGEDVLMDKDIIYHRLVIIEPSINAQDIRDFCAMRNREVQRHIARLEEQKRREEEEKMKRKRAELERSAIIAQAARMAGVKPESLTEEAAKTILKEAAIRNRMMDEVATGEQHLPAHLTRR